MAKVLLTGWEEGFKKIATTKLLREHTSLSLSEAKKCVDDCLEGKYVVIEVAGSVEPQFLVEEIIKLKGLAEIQ
jgi:ribosomal protein L7/L12